MQSKALAAVLAVGVTASVFTAPTASSATVGAKNSEGECSINLTEPEAIAWTALKSQVDWERFASDLASSIEKERPQLKDVADQFLKTQEVQNYLREQNDGGVSPDTYFEYSKAKAEVLDALPESDAGWADDYFVLRLLPLLTGAVDLLDFLSDFAGDDLTVNEKDASSFSFTSGQLIRAEFEGEPDNAKVAENFSGSQSGRFIDANLPPYATAWNQAAKVCGDGGNRTVAFPTKGSVTAPTSTTAMPQPSKTTPSTTTPVTTTPQASKEPQPQADSSSAGKVIGILVGVLAIVGLAAAGVMAFGPQLGIQLPF